MFKRARPIRVLGLFLAIYLLTCVGLWRYQARLMFFPSSVLKSTPADMGMAYYDVWLQDGQIHSWWVPAMGSASAPVILYLHGNGSNLGDLPHRLKRFHRWGYSTLAIDYRGYGRSAGPFPHEQQVYADAAAAWHYLTEQRNIAGEQIVIYGRSMGGAISIHLATAHPEVGGLVLESTFTSMQAMVKHYLPLPILPVERLLHQRFNSLEKVRSLSLPVLVIHGTDDRVVPLAMSRTLYDAWAADNTAHKEAHKELVWVGHGGHSNLLTAIGPCYGDRPMMAGRCYDDAVKTFLARYAE